jgi:hypothetical protein
MECAAMSDVPQASFMNFLGGLASQALMQFGEVPNPISGKREANPEYARYTVQLLEILLEKTKGNRTSEEEQYLVGMITDFRRRLERSA